MLALIRWLNSKIIIWSDKLIDNVVGYLSKKIKKKI